MTMTLETLAERIKGVQVSCDRIEENQGKQWDRIDEHSNSISFVKAVTGILIPLNLAIAGAIITMALK